MRQGSIDKQAHDIIAYENRVLLPHSWKKIQNALIAVKNIVYAHEYSNSE